MTSSSLSSKMFQTTLGVAISLVGLAGILFNKQVARSYKDFHRWAFSLEISFSPDGNRAGFISTGLSVLVFGLLIALHMIPTR